MADEWRVLTTAGGSVRTLFRGMERDARVFVERHFPRAHINAAGPGDVTPTPDVALVGPDGNRYHYNGPESNPTHGLGVNPEAYTQVNDNGEPVTSTSETPASSEPPVITTNTEVEQ